MVADTGAKGLPVWFFEGIAEYAALVRDPKAVPVFGRVTAATYQFNSGLHPDAQPGTFPTLRELTPSYWDCLERTNEKTKRIGYGMAYMAVKYMIEKVGTERVAQVIQATAIGEPFDSALLRHTNYTVEQLDAEYRGTFSRRGWDPRFFTNPDPPIRCNR